MKSFGQYLEEKSLSHLENLDVSTVVKEWYSGATDRTQIYESTVCIMAKTGSASIGSIKQVLGHEEMNPIARGFYERFFAEYKDDPAALQGLSTWVKFLGNPITELGKMKSFIHNSIDKYYSSVPATFEVPDASKANTADCVLIVNGTASQLYNALEDLKSKDETTQIRRIRPFGKNGGVTIVDSNKKGIISFYQVSLKNEGQVGKAGGWVNQNWLGGGTVSSPKQAKQVRGLINQEVEYDFDEMLEEGKLIDWAKGKAAKVVSSIQNFVTWAANKLKSLISKMTGRAEKYANSKIKKNRGIKAIEDIFGSAGLSLNEEFLVEGPDVKLTPAQVENFKIVADEFLKKDEINAIHRKNIAMVEVLNSAFKAKDRQMDPVVILGDGEINIKPWIAELSYLASIQYNNKTKKFTVKGKPITSVTRKQVEGMYKIASNYGANVVVEGLLKSASDTLATHKTIGRALFAMAGNLEAEVKFGNTALPILICYGGKTQKLVVLGKREDYSKELTDKLVKTSKGVDTDYPVLALRYNKSGSSPQYNVVNMKLLNSFVDDNGSPSPRWLEFGIRTNSGSSFTCTVEASQVTSNWRGR